MTKNLSGACIHLVHQNHQLQALDVQAPERTREHRDAKSRTGVRKRHHLHQEQIVWSRPWKWLSTSKRTAYSWYTTPTETYSTAHPTTSSCWRTTTLLHRWTMGTTVTRMPWPKESTAYSNRSFSYTDATPKKKSKHSLSNKYLQWKKTTPESENANT